LSNGGSGTDFRCRSRQGSAVNVPKGMASRAPRRAGEDARKSDHSAPLMIGPKYRWVCRREQTRIQAVLHLPWCPARGVPASPCTDTIIHVHVWSKRGCLLSPSAVRFSRAGLLTCSSVCVCVCVCVCVIAHSQSGQEDWLGKLRRAAARERCVHKPRRCHQTRVCTLTRPSVVSRVSRPFSPTSL
jgi:hypothetical protein